MPTDSFLRNEKVLVTGATGFIGSHLVQRLLRAGARVRAMAHYRSDPRLHNLEYLSRAELEAVEVVRGNIEDTFFVRSAVQGCNFVFHLAALIGIPYSYVAPYSYVGTNICGTLNVLEACRAEGTARLIHTSTSECYGTALRSPIDESHPLQGQSPYAATKIAADKLVESYYNSFDLAAVTVRPFNTYGPRQSTRAVIPTIITQLLGDSEQLELGSLSPVRDLTFVSDTVEGFIRAASAPGAVGELINLGVGRGITIGELAQLIMHAMGKIVPIKVSEQRVRPERSEVGKLISDNRKALEVLSWQPEIDLEEGLRRTINFLSSHADTTRADQYGV